MLTCKGLTFCCQGCRVRQLGEGKDSTLWRTLARFGKCKTRKLANEASPQCWRNMLSMFQMLSKLGQIGSNHIESANHIRLPDWLGSWHVPGWPGRRIAHQETPAGQSLAKKTKKGGCHWKYKHLTHAVHLWLLLHLQPNSFVTFRIPIVDPLWL